MDWLSEPLADAGFVVVAVDHHGNTFVDGYLPEGFARWWERPRDLTFALDEVGRREHIGPVGAAGFSIGGYTAAALLGARVDPSRYAALFSGALAFPPPPEYPNLEHDLRERLSDDDVARWVGEAGADYADDRVLAAFLVCPGVGTLLDEAALLAIEKPVAVRSAGADEITPAEDNADVYARTIPSADGQSVGAAVDHYAFLADNPEFADVREGVAHEAVDFFDTHLRGPA
jgi:predicted dienelactone hydrolase